MFQSGNETQADWQLRFARLAELDPHTVYAMLKLRVDIFVVEQQCAYPELDGRDTAADTLHLLCFKDNTLVGCLRLLLNPCDPGSDTACIGRVAVAAEHRQHGIGLSMMQAALAHLHTIPPVRHVSLSAQTVAAAFYERLGFRACSAPYDEDGIEHIDMSLALRT